MNLTQIKCLLVFCLFATIGFGPVSITCLIGFYIVVMRPFWFFVLVNRLYDQPLLLHEAISNYSWPPAIRARINCFLCLLVIFILDIAPIPVASMIAFPVILFRPLWFLRIVSRVYGEL